jgi:alkyl hydroperoxide reductase subunit AhpF
MADITADVMIVGTGPAGSAAAAILASYGIKTFIINRYRWLATTPRAHITNQRSNSKIDGSFSASIYMAHVFWASNLVMLHFPSFSIELPSTTR